MSVVKTAASSIGEGATKALAYFAVLWLLMKKPPVTAGVLESPVMAHTPPTPDFTPAEFPRTVRGDIDGNGIVTMMDSMAINRMVLGLPAPDGKPYTSAQFAAADLDGDGQVTMADVTRLQRIMLKLE